MARGQQRYAHDGRHLSIIIWLISLLVYCCSEPHFLSPFWYHCKQNTDALQNAIVSGGWPRYLPASSESLVRRHDDRCRYWFSASITCVIVIAGILVARAYRQFGWWLCPTENKQITIFCLLWLKVNICISPAHLLRHTETHSHSLGYTCI